MSSNERLKVFGARAAKFGISLTHSVVILLAFWVAMDLMQSQFRAPGSVGILSASKTSPQPTLMTAPVPDIDGLAVKLHAYGYHAQKAREALQATSTTVAKAPVVVAKVTPRVNKTSVTKNPKVLVGQAPRALVKHMLPKGYVDARGPANSYTRVDL